MAATSPYWTKWFEAREKSNWLIYQLFAVRDFDRCLRVIEDELKKNNALTEVPIYIKALILRHQGRIEESLQLFQAATCLNPLNVNNLKQVGRSLYLLGKHKAAIDIFEEALQLQTNDWEIYHSLASCYIYLHRYKNAIDNLENALDISKKDVTYLQLVKIYTIQEDFESAIETCKEALGYFPAHSEVLTTLGLLQMRVGDNDLAFNNFVKALNGDPKNPKAILAAGSIIQDRNDMDMALLKYRVAATQTPHSPQLWNNIGMCFFGKQRYVAAIACLKRSLYLDPFEWITAVNLGLVHLHTDQFASAFLYLSAAINLNPSFSNAFMYLAITLARLEDFSNSCAAFERAIELGGDHLVHLNYAITLWNNDEEESARDQLKIFKKLFQKLTVEEQEADVELTEQLNALDRALAGAKP